MDADWERAIPFYEISLMDAESIFMEYNPGIFINELDRVNTGCRNSNYIVSTNKGLFFMQICPESVGKALSEQSIAEIKSHGVNMPEILYRSSANSTGRLVMIYEFIDGTPLGIGDVTEDIISQVAGAAAGIHNADIKNDGTYISLDDYPAFFGWYDMFLNKEAAVNRLGKETVARIKAMLADNLPGLMQIERYESFIHCDFRPANMLVDNNGKLWVTDWEFAGFGHTLADIGQFFRYHERFTGANIEQFGNVYNRLAKTPLPDGWYSLCRLRDLVNPLQMLGVHGSMPNRERDLIRVVNSTLEYFGY